MFAQLTRDLFAIAKFLLQYQMAILESTPHRTFYSSAIVVIALSCRVLSYLTLKSGLEVTQDHSNWYHIRNLGGVSYSPSIASMVLSCIICEIKPDIG